MTDQTPETPELDPLADDEACAAAIGEIAAIDADLTRLEAAKAEAIQAAAKKAEDKAGPLSTRRQQLVRRIEAYCVANRARLTEDGKRKFAPFATGEAAWRKGRDSVTIDAAEADAIVKKLKTMGRAFVRFIRSKEEPARNILMAATPEEKAKLRRLKGITYKPGEEYFEIKPVAVPLADRPA